MLPSTVTSDEHKITAIGTSFKWKMSRFFLSHHPSDRRIWSRIDDHRPDGPVQLQQQLLQGQVPRKHVQNRELTINIVICGSIALISTCFRCVVAGPTAGKTTPISLATLLLKSALGGGVPEVIQNYQIKVLTRGYMIHATYGPLFPPAMYHLVLSHFRSLLGGRLQ